MANPAGFLGFRQMLKTLIDNYCTGMPWQPDTERIEKELRLVHAAYHSLRTRKMEKI
jgi:hypothetical protein